MRGRDRRLGKWERVSRGAAGEREINIGRESTKIRRLVDIDIAKE